MMSGNNRKGKKKDRSHWPAAGGRGHQTRGGRDSAAAALAADGYDARYGRYERRERDQYDGYDGGRWGGGAAAASGGAGSRDYGEWRYQREPEHEEHNGRHYGWGDEHHGEPRYDHHYDYDGRPGGCCGPTVASSGSSLPPPPGRQGPSRQPRTQNGFIVGHGPAVRGLPQRGGGERAPERQQQQQQQAESPPQLSPTTEADYVWEGGGMRQTEGEYWGGGGGAQEEDGGYLDRLLREVQRVEAEAEEQAPGGEVSPEAGSGGIAPPQGSAAAEQMSPAALAAPVTSPRSAPQASPPAPTGALLGLPQVVALMGVSAHGAALLALEVGQRGRVETEQLGEAQSFWVAAVRCGLLRPNPTWAQQNPPWAGGAAAAAQGGGAAAAQPPLPDGLDFAGRPW